MDKPTIKKHSQTLRLLKELGFATNPYNHVARNIDDVWEIFENLNIQRDLLKYQIDGLVIKSNDYNLTEKAGIVGKTQRARAAMKFGATETTSKLKNVTWQVGRTGKLTPVAEFDPVFLSGSTVSRATFHNYKEIIENNLCYEDTLTLRKAGDIIPEVVTVLTNLRSDNPKQIQIPNNCPSCDTKLEISSTGVDLFCPNIDTCKSQIIGRLSYYTQRANANVTGLSEKNIQNFVENYGVLEFVDLYELPFDKIVNQDRYGEKSVENLKKSLEKSKKIDDYRLLSGFCIEGVGPEISKLILKQMYTKSQKTNEQK
jgi:DNA ligase (NAD+)